VENSIDARLVSSLNGLVEAFKDVADNMVENVAADAPKNLAMNISLHGNSLTAPGPAVEDGSFVHAPPARRDPLTTPSIDENGSSISLAVDGSLNLDSTTASIDGYGAIIK
jgi:hypothetical protein